MQNIKFKPYEGVILCIKYIHYRIIGLSHKRKKIGTFFIKKFPWGCDTINKKNKNPNQKKGLHN